MAHHEVTEATIEQVIKDNDIALIDFWATWCPPCRAFGPVFEKASEENPDMFFGKVDIDQNQTLAAQAGVQAVPTLMITKKGHVVYKEAGALRASDLNDLIAQVKALDIDAALAAQQSQDAQTTAEVAEDIDLVDGE